MELNELESALESVLFASGEPVPVERLCLGLEVDRPTLDAVAQELMDKYKYERRGMRIVRMDTSYQMCSAPEYAPHIRKTLESRKPPKLFQPALEVLAVIAYYSNRLIGNGANYLFLASPEEAPSVLDILPPNFFLRTLIMAAAITALYAVVYLPWYLKDKKAKKAGQPV